MGVKGCLFVFVLSRYALKRLREVIRRYLSAVCGGLWSLDASEGISDRVFSSYNDEKWLYIEISLKSTFFYI